MKRIIMHGCNGRMGQMIEGIVKEDESVEIVAGVDSYLGRDTTFPVFDHISKCTVEADVIIDFSNAGAVNSVLTFATTNQIPVVLCTTGLSEEQLDLVEAASNKVAILKSANMSLGINMLMKVLQEAINILAPAGFDVEIVEKHHNQKLDAPSGTALALADAMNDVSEPKYEYVFDRSQVRKKRDKNEMGIVAVRGGSIVGEHEVIFAGADEVIEFKHTA